MSDKPLKPFLKWPGGKRWLFESAQFAMPEFEGQYIEPFVGGGAVFFQARPRKALLGDTNGRLIELYTVIRDEWKTFERLLRRHAAAHSKEYYYETRAKDFPEPITRAAQFLYLNRTCWNGLYRENRNGRFNVPLGTKQTVIFPNDDFRVWSAALKEATLVRQDFEQSIRAAQSGDLLFVDPPYSVRHNTNGFLRYSQRLFAWEDQLRLRRALGRAVDKGVNVVLTNADHENVRELYRGFGTHRRLYRHSVIAGNAIHRASSTELLVMSFADRKEDERTDETL